VTNWDTSAEAASSIGQLYSLLCTDLTSTLALYTEHQLFQVTERSISVDFSSKHDSNAFLNLFPNVLSPLQALWQARWPLLSFSSSMG
jgi:hypothetical protein